MARSKASVVQDALTTVLPRRRIRVLARRSGVVRRRRKLDVVALVYSLVLGFASGERRTLTTLRREYLKATGVRLAPSSFHARFNAELVELMQTLTAEALQRLSHVRPKLRGVLAPFVEVLATDSSLIRLHNALESDYPSVWTHYMKASAKLAVVMNVVGRGAKTVAITHGSRHDVHLLQAGPWMKGRLLLFDLGYYRTELFEEIDAHGGFFLSRMKKQGNPLIIRSHRRAHHHLVGTKLRDAQRLVWEVELLFRELKGSYRLGQMPSANRHVTETLIYTALLTLLVSRRLYRALRARWRLDPQRLPFDRWAVLVATVANDLLDIALNRHDRNWRASRIERFLRREAVDPNTTRIPLPYRAQSGVYQPA